MVALLLGLSPGLDDQDDGGGGGRVDCRPRGTAQATRKGATEFSVPKCKHSSPVTDDGDVVDEINLVVDDFDLVVVELDLDFSFSSRFLQMELSQLKITFECLGLGGNEEEEILTALNIYISKQFNYKYIRIMYKYNMIYKYILTSTLTPLWSAYLSRLAI